MLDFLWSVWSKIVALFTYIWNYIVWYYSSGHTSLMEYTNGFRSPVWAYVYWYQWSLQHYRDVAQGKTDDIAVNNYPITKYTANYSYGSILHYRNNLEAPLGYLGTTLFNPILNFFNVGLVSLQGILNVSAVIRNYIFGDGYGVVKSYQDNEKPTVVRLKPYDRNVEWSNSEPRFTRAKEYLDLYYAQHSDLVRREKPYLDGLVGKYNAINLMTEPTRVTRAVDLLDNKYGPVITLAGLQAQMSKLAEPVTFSRLNWLVDKGYDKLVETNNDTPDTFLERIAVIFLDWFFDLVWKWLNQPAE